MKSKIHRRRCFRIQRQVLRINLECVSMPTHDQEPDVDLFVARIFDHNRLSIRVAVLLAVKIQLVTVRRDRLRFIHVQLCQNRLQTFQVPEITSIGMQGVDVLIQRCVRIVVFSKITPAAKIDGPPMPSFGEHCSQVLVKP